MRRLRCAVRDGHTVLTARISKINGQGERLASMKTSPKDHSGEMSRVEIVLCDCLKSVEFVGLSLSVKTILLIIDGSSHKQCSREIVWTSMKLKDVG